MSIRTAALAAVVALAGPTALAAQAARDVVSADLERAALTITEADYLQRVGVLAHDSMGGRDTPSEGLEKAAAWIASELAGMGLRGAAEDGGFIQRYPLRSVELDRERSGLEAGGVRLEYGADVLPIFGLLPGGEASAELVLVSGSQDVEAGLRGNAVRGKHAVLVLAAGAPGPTQADQRVMAALRSAGAASVLVTSAAADDSWSASASRILEPSLSRGWVTEPADRAGPFRPMLLVRTSALERLLEGRGADLGALQRRAREELRVDRLGLTARLSQVVRERTVDAPNVVAVLEGSDPELRDEYVAFSAHMDHVGIGLPNEAGDSIYNGADDDASGTTAVIEIAEAMASLPEPPRRSLLFLLVSGEEKGLWGSEYFSEYPAVPLDRVVADLNIDMVGRNWTDTIVAIGKEHSDLGATLERVNAEHPELGMTAIDDLWPEENFYFRSDHYNFARKGVPILFFFNGTHEDYHGLDDEPDRIDGEKAARVARLIFYLGAEVANTTARPQWDPESYRNIVEQSAR
ncbi:MAG TPA: M28 family peptidase [Longimicrobiales bacterium]|nr:M28 family peptidase [Longimicrobiales bacterium]